MVQLRDYQIEAINSIHEYFKTKDGNCVVAMPTGCHAKGSMIMLFDGNTKPVEEIVVGDLLMGPDSTPREVLSLARGRQEMRRVVPVKGEPFIVNMDHKLSLYRTNEGKQHKPIEIVTVREYESGSKWFKHIRKLRRVPVDFQRKDHPLDPYILGLFLGDGSMINGMVNYTIADEELADIVCDYIKRLGCKIRISEKPNNKARTYYVVDPLSSRTVENRITSIFRKLDLQEKRAWDKSIPYIYKCGDREQRLKLLAGLLDSDGWLQNDCVGFEFCTTSSQLAKDVQFLARSLGFSCNNFKKKSHYVKEGIRFEAKDSYKLHINGDMSELPFCRIYHRDRVKGRSQIKNVSVTGFSVEVLPEDDYYGFSLDEDHLYLDENFIVHHNTGKSVVLGGFLQSVFKYANQRVIVATHVKELIQQDYDALMRIWPQAPAGIYSSGLGRRDRYCSITFAGIASVVRRAIEFGRVDLLIIDEAHLVSPSEETSYQNFIRDLRAINPLLKVIGLTATPWRLGHGRITEGGDIFTDLCFDITGLHPFNRLIAEGYLSPLIPKPTKVELDVEGVHMRMGEFNSTELQLAVDKAAITEAALKEAMEYGHDRNHWLIFAAGVDHAIHIADMMTQVFGVECKAVHSKMKNDERDQVLADFKSGRLRCVVNNGILTTGFDHPGIDFIIVLRPTASTVLWVQLAGRGTRPVYAPGFDLTTIEGRLEAIAAGPKKNCLLLDFARNTERLGPINDPVIPRKKGEKGGEAPVKICPHCNTYNHASARNCILCGAEFTFQVKIKQVAGTNDLIKSDIPITEVFKVDQITYVKHQKVGRPDSMKLNYYCGLRSFHEFVPLEATGSIRGIAQRWWNTRAQHAAPPGLPVMPFSVDDALQIATKLPPASHIRVWTNKQYPEIIAHCFDGTAFGTQEVEAIKVLQSSDTFNRTILKPWEKKNKSETVKFDNLDDDIPF